jgi:hypothetical protein
MNLEETHIDRKIISLRIVVLLTLSAAIFSCQQETDIYQNSNCKNTISRTCVIYEQTYCADPWGQNNEDDGKLIKNLIEYFDNLGITICNYKTVALTLRLNE